MAKPADIVQRFMGAMGKGDFITGSRVADRQISSQGFIEFVIDRYRTAMPLMQFLAESIDR